MLKKINVTILGILFATTQLFASGFQINEHSARAMALGGAFTGLANDPSAVYFNPAGITQLSGTHLMAGVTLIVPKSTFRGPSPAITEWELEKQIFNPINFYVTHQMSEKFHLGFSVNNPYGLGTKWPSDWVGKYMAVETEIRTFYFNAVAAYEVSKQFSLGFGFTYALGDVLISRMQNLSPFNADAEISLEGNGSGAGFNFGLLFKPSENFSIGAAYKSRVNFKFEGDATVTAPKQFNGLIPTGKIEAPLTAPDVLSFGIGVKPSDNLTLSADLQFTMWSTYDKLEITFKDFVDSKTGKPMVTSSVRDYEDSFIGRFGAEYVVSSMMTLRAGFLYDKNPVKDERVDPTLPDADRLGFNAGLGIKLADNLSLDLAYMFLRFSERKIDNSLESYSGIEDSVAPMNGVYNSVAHLFAVNLSVNF